MKPLSLFFLLFSSFFLPSHRSHKSDAFSHVVICPKRALLFGGSFLSLLLLLLSFLIWSTPPLTCQRTNEDFRLIFMINRKETNQGKNLEKERKEREEKRKEWKQEKWASDDEINECEKRKFRCCKGPFPTFFFSLSLQGLAAASLSSFFLLSAPVYNSLFQKYRATKEMEFH